MTDTTDTDTDELSRRRRNLTIAGDVADLLKDLGDRIAEYGKRGVPAKEWIPWVATQLPPPMDRMLLMAAPYIGATVDGLAMVGVAAVVRVGEDGSFLGSAKDLKGGLAAQLGYAGDAKLGESRTSQDIVNARLYAMSVLSSAEASDELDNLAECFMAMDREIMQTEDSAAGHRMRSVITRLFAEAGQERDVNMGADQSPTMQAFVLLRGTAQPLGGMLSVTPEGGLKFMMGAGGGPEKVPDKMIEQFFDYSDVVSVAVERKIGGSAVSSIISPS